jgi:glucose/mannose-6-phosphate isomerase
LAKKIYNRVPIIYADSERLKTVAVRLKGQICENSKMLAYHSVYPEMNHNEIVGWENNTNLFSNYFIIWLLDSEMNERNKARQKIVMNMLSEISIDQFKLEVLGNSYRERFLLLIHYGDWLSYWCAILHKTDPSPVRNIIKLKNKLSEIV